MILCRNFHWDASKMHPMGVAPEPRVLYEAKQSRIKNLQSLLMVCILYKMHPLGVAPEPCLIL
jgi:hypothetical protein